MNSQPEPLNLQCYVAGERINSTRFLSVRNPYNGRKVGRVGMAGPEHTAQAISLTRAGNEALTRFQRSEILERARQLLEQRHESFAQLMTAESGLCVRETRYEVKRALDVLRFASMEALRDDGQVFSCDISPNGKARKIFTLREPLSLIVAITPFNHPLNQVAHKLAPAIAAGSPVILKPSEKTPLTALRFAELLFEAGLPGSMLSVLLGPTEEVAIPLVQDARVELVTFTGSVAVGKRLSATAGYKRLVLELGGNDPLIVLEDADLDLAARLAAEGSFRNSGQRCTAVKRILVQESVRAEFVQRLVRLTQTYKCGDPADPETYVGTVIDEAAATHLEGLVKKAVAAGAKVLCGGERHGALLQPTILTEVPRDSEMVVCESFGPLAPVMGVADLDDAIEVANSTAYGLSAGVVTNELSLATKAIKKLRAGTVNINEVPGYRIENSPFGGIKDSGLGAKEGVIEAMKLMSTVKTFSLPW